jgi:hypothetical protein
MVAIYDYRKVYLLPRYDYSPTTWKHVHAFIQDYTVNEDMCASELRKAASHGFYNYEFATGFSFNNREWKEW